MTARRRSILERVLHGLVRLLPEDFLSEFGGAIGADLAERSAAGDRSGLLRRELPSLAVTVVREHASTLRHDAAYAVRLMRRTPGFTALAVLMLALGTGVNAAMFSIIDAVMLQTPFTNPERIVTLRVASDRGFTAAIPAQQFAEIAASPGPLRAVAAIDLGEHVFTGHGDPQRIDVECVSAEMADVLGTRPFLGRWFSAAEARPGAPATVVLSFDFWRSLGGSPSLLGAPLTINQTPVTIVGVMPRGFTGPFSRSDVAAWLPLGRQVAGGGAAGCEPPTWVNAFARLQPGLTAETAAPLIPGVDLVPLEAQTYETIRTPFRALTAAVLCVLLIACFNVGGLQLERTLARRRELALRLALGASRSRLVRQIVTENLLLAVGGALAGLAATALTLRSIVSLVPPNLPRLDLVAVNMRVFGFTIATAIAAGLLSSLIPIVRTNRLNPGIDIADGSRWGNRAGGRTRRVLVVVEIGLSIVVLVGAALMIQTFLALRPTRPGFDPSGKISLLIRLPGETPAGSERFFNQLFERLDATPAIRAAAGSTYLPMRGTTRSARVTFAGTTAEINTHHVTPGYFELMKIAVASGRTFIEHDRSGSAPVAIVNEVFAKRIRPDGRVIGELIAVARGNDRPVERQIVGVVANTRFVGSHTRPRSEVYVPYAQSPLNVLHVIVQADGGVDSESAAAVRAAVRALRPDLAVEPFEALPALVGRSVMRWRFGAWLLGVFAVLAVALAAIGLMTTIGWWVRVRTRELGVRIALGATQRQIVRLVLGQGMALGVAGIAAGCLAAAGLTRYMQGWLYEITPLDPTTFTICALGMIVVAAASLYLPARRATRVDPVIALRSE